MVIAADQTIAEDFSCQGVSAFDSAEVCAEAKSSDRPTLLTRMRQAMHYRPYSRRTGQTYCGWARRFILGHNVWYRAVPDGVFACEFSKQHWVGPR